MLCSYSQIRIHPESTNNVMFIIINNPALAIELEIYE